nr:MAG TPA: hypothetical protein [Caudoviricetes sp.]
MATISKVQLDQLYEIKDAFARTELGKLGTVATHDIAATISDVDGKVADAATVKAYVDAQVGSIHKFDVKIYDELPVASADTKFILALVAAEGAVDGSYVEYITVENPEGTFKWEQIGTTKTDLGDYVLKTVQIAGLAIGEGISTEDLKTALGLKALAYKDSAKGTVAGQTISGVKATGSITGSIDVALTQTATDATVTKKDYTPAGTVTGSVTATGTVATEISTESAAATLTRGDYTPAGSVTVTPTTGSIDVIDSVGTAASKAADTFDEGTASTYKQGAKAAWSASVADEVLSFSFTANGDDTFTAGKLPSYTEGKFTPNTLPTKKAAAVVTGITGAEFTGTKETGLKVTGANYDKATGATSAFTGTAADIAAEFAGTTAQNALVDTVKYNAASVNAEGTTFTADAVELAVGDIAVAAKEVTVS